MKISLNRSISKNIKKYRLLHNLTQEQLAEQLGLDTQYYAQLERGERNFTIEKIASLCSIFHISIQKIVEIEEHTENTDVLLSEIQGQLKTLNYHQLVLLQKFITDVIPYMDS